MSLLTLSGIKLPVTKGEGELIKLAQKKLGCPPAHFRILKKSLDARDKNNLLYLYTIEFSSKKQPQAERPLERLPERKHPEKPVLIVGGGPAGMFCALRLLERGIAPILIERGAPVDERAKTIDRFSKEGVLDVNTNVQFGEGGAGTFSDGKLNTQTHNPQNAEVLRTFVRYGAPEEILYLNKPHIGSDNLKKVVKNMRESVIERGGKVLFYTRLEDIKIESGKLKTATYKDLKSGETTTVEPSALVLAIGHSARDTFETLLSRGVYMKAKDFAVGVRIEHLQEEIGRSQYGSKYALLPPADYKLVSHASERAAFTFCMCPGGYVMPAASEEGGVVVNGMSNYARDGKNANSALIVQVTKADFKGEHPLCGVEFQREIERAAFEAGGGTYAAPVQKLGDFLKDRPSDGFSSVLPTYPKTQFSDLRAVLPAPIVSALKAGVTDMDRRLKGFANPDALLTAVESRTSSPVRIERNETLQSVACEGLYPCGEGAGYAGGITSSAADGIRVADALFSCFVTK